MSELPPSLRALLDDARRDEEPSDQDARRVAKALGAVIPGFAPFAAPLLPPPGAVDAATHGAGQALGAGAAKGGALALGAAGKTWVAALAIGTAASFAAVGAYQFAVGRSSAPGRVPPAVSEPARPAAAAGPAAEATPPLEPRADAPPAAASPAEPPVASGARAGVVPVRPRAAQPVEPGAPARSADATPVASVQDELALMRDATRAIRDGDPARARHLLQQHAERFPEGTLAQERTGLTVLALCAQGLQADGRALRERFLREAPDSPLAARVRAACEAGPEQ